MADEPKLVQPSSPTGQPLVPPAVAKWLAALYAVLVGLEGGLAYAYGTDHEAVKLLFVALATVGPLLGLASPGFRKGAPLALLCLLPLTSCAHLKPWGVKTVDCTQESVMRQVPVVLPQVASILASQAPDWDVLLDALVDSAGDAALCAVKVAVGLLEVNEDAAPTQASGDAEALVVSRGAQLSRAYGYLAGERIRFTPVAAE